MPANNGVYDTANGHLALAMNHLPALGFSAGIAGLVALSNLAGGFQKRDEIKYSTASRLREQTTGSVVK